MQVVEDDDQRPRARGAPARKLAIASKSRKRACSSSSLGRLGRPRRGSSRTSGTTLGDLGRRAAQLPGQRHRVRLAHVGADRLRPGPVGGRPLALVAAPPVDLRAAHARVGRQLLGGARLADAGLADEQHQPAAARRAPRRAAPRSSASSRSRPTNTPPASRSSGFSCAARRAPRLGGRVADRLEPLAHRGRGSGPLAGRLREQVAGSARRAPPAPRGCAGRRDRRGVEVLADDRDRVVAGEAAAARRHLVEQRAERVEVRARARRAGPAPARAAGRRPSRRSSRSTAARERRSRREPEVARAGPCRPRRARRWPA